MEQVKQVEQKMNKNLLTSSESEVIGSFIGMGIVGLCFGLMLAVKILESLEYCISRKCL